MKKLMIMLLIASFAIIGCKEETKKSDAKTDTKKEVVAENIKEASFKISGMTCEVGCAKTIQSKLSKKEGVVNAEVIFKDSIAKIKYDASKTNQNDLMAFVEGIADGNTYKTCKIDCKKSKEECSTKKQASTCSKTCKETCKASCKENAGSSKKSCSIEEKTACAKSCESSCCKSA